MGKDSPKLDRNWRRLRTDPKLRENLETRSKVLSAIRAFFNGRGFVEIDPPILVPLPGMEPYLDPIAVDLGLLGVKRRFFLHTSPEYSMKKLLAGGMERIYALTHAFRGDEISDTHNVEFAILEWYRAHVDYASIMKDCEELIWVLACSICKEPWAEVGGRKIFLEPPWQRITVREAMARYAGVDLERVDSVQEFVEHARRLGYKLADRSWTWEDVFFKIFLQEVEPKLPQNRPYFLIDYPHQMASLARKKPDDPRWVERFELYAGGLELANGFTELTDPVEQRMRLDAERQQRCSLGKETYPVDLSFIEALEIGLPPCAGVALGVDRLVMLFTGASSIKEVIPFPMEDLILDWSVSREEEP